MLETNSIRGTELWVVLAGLLLSGPARADLDLAIGDLDGITAIAREGTYPNGATALSMPSTVCNVGSVDVSYRAPMAPEHPVLVMQLYREMEGRFEQIGLSDARHEFFALSSNACSSCPEPSGGTVLSPGCSSTSGTGINADRHFLGPRDEIDPWTGRWECLGSHFAGGEPDCVRRHDGSGHGALDHRLSTRDEDLGLSGAGYFYEMYFLAEGDFDHRNNLGSRTCTMVWTGSSWAFATPAAQTMEEGPALARWGGTQSWATIPDDGIVLLASKAIDLGNDRTRYEYALFNLDSNRRARSISIPVGTANVEGLGFHDADGDPSNDWSVSLAGGVLTWETEAADVDPEANALVYGMLFNFWFESDTAPAQSEVTIEAWQTTGDDQTTALAEVPASPAGVPGRSDSGISFSVVPNPLMSRADVSFSVIHAESVSLEIYDAGGGLVRVLLDGVIASGRHRVEWDGKDDSGRATHAGVYYARLRAEGGVSVRSLTVLH